VGEVAHISHKVLQAQALDTGLQVVAGMVGTVVEQQGTCAVLVSAVGVLQGQDQALACSAFVGCD